MSVTRELSRGEQLRLSADYAYPVEKLEVRAGTKVVVAKACRWNEQQIPIHFVEESLRQQEKGGPFYAHRHNLEEREAVCPANG